MLLCGQREVAAAVATAAVDSTETTKAIVDQSVVHNWRRPPSRLRNRAPCHEEFQHIRCRSCPVAREGVRNQPDIQMSEVSLAKASQGPARLRASGWPWLRHMIVR